VLVLIHPNNPTGTRFPVEELLAWQTRLDARGGWLVVDEAFMDATPEASLAPFCPRSGLILLRSLGKFFGLAGARVGFVLAPPQVLERLAGLLGPWAVSSPARWVATRALADHDWQQANRRYLAALLRRRGLPPRRRLQPLSVGPHVGCGTAAGPVSARGDPDPAVHQAAEPETRFSGNRSGLGTA